MAQNSSQILEVKAQLQQLNGFGAEELIHVDQLQSRSQQERVLPKIYSNGFAYNDDPAWLFSLVELRRGQ